MFSSSPTPRTESFDVDLQDRALIDDCLATLEPSEHSHKTCAKYELNMLEFAEWLKAKGVSVLDAKGKHVKQFMVYLATGGRAAVDARRLPEQQLGWQDTLAASTRKGHFAAIRTVYKHLVFDEQLDRDPTYGMRAPKVEIKRGLVIEHEEVRTILDAPGKPRCRVQAFLLAFTLARMGSIVGLRWCDVDFENDFPEVRLGTASDTLARHGFPRLGKRLRATGLAVPTLVASLADSGLGWLGKGLA
jgi:integrase